MKYIEICVILLNIAAFIVWCVDKAQAKRGGWRVPEKMLFLLAAAGGSIGAIAAMHIVRHKTRKWYFRIGLPAILILQIAAVWLVYRYVK